MYWYYWVFGSVFMFTFGLVAMVKKNQWLRVVFVATTIIFVLGGHLGNMISVANAQFAAEHKGHDELHAKFVTALQSAKHGDLIISGDDILVVVTVMEYEKVILWRDAACPLCGGEANRSSVEWLASVHARPVHRGTPEYDQAIVKRFGQLYR